MTQLPPPALPEAPEPTSGWPLRLPKARPVIFLYLGAAGIVLWAFSGFTWWVFAVGLGGVLIARLMVGLFPPSVRQWVGPFVLATMFLFLATQVSPWALGITACLLGVTVAIGLRHWHRWRVVLSVALVALIGCTAGYVLDIQARKRMEQEQLQQAHEQNVAQLRPSAPQGVMTMLMNLIAFNRQWETCFQFSDGAKAQFVASVPGAADCNDAVQKLSTQVKDKNRYSRPDWESSALQINGEDATMDACAATWSDTFKGHQDDMGPKIGKLTLARQFHTGWIVTNYEPCK